MRSKPLVGNPKRTRWQNIRQIQTTQQTDNTDNLTGCGLLLASFTKMTLEEDIVEMKPCITDHKMEVSSALKEVLLRAQEQNRLTCGVLDAGKMLEMNPDGVMVCILPENASDVTMKIHCTLIEAFCWENDIRLLKVDDVEKVSALFQTQTSAQLNDNDLAAGRAQRLSMTDFNCILVEYPLDECSEAEEDLLEYHKTTCDIVPQPVVELKV